MIKVLFLPYYCKYRNLPASVKLQLVCIFNLFLICSIHETKQKISKV
jgi:hypothetical protein